MATIVNNPPAAGDNGGNGMGFILGVLLLVLFGYLLLAYGLPYLRGAAGTTAPQINVPGKVDVNVKQSK